MLLTSLDRNCNLTDPTCQWQFATSLKVPVTALWDSVSTPTNQELDLLPVSEPSPRLVIRSDLDDWRLWHKGLFPGVENIFRLEPPPVCRVNVTVGSLVSVLTSPEPTREAVIPLSLPSRCLLVALRFFVCLFVFSFLFFFRNLNKWVQLCVCLMFCLYLLRSLCF